MLQTTNVILISTDGRLILRQRDDKSGIVNPQHILFIDDLQENVEAAQAVGLRTILATEEPQIVRDVRKTLAL